MSSGVELSARPSPLLSENRFTRVLFWVVSIAYGGPVAVINWGWEHESFYAKWIKGGHRGLAKDLKGPSLNIGSPQSDLAPAILDLTANVLLEDEAYRDRIKRHYGMFRKRIDGKKQGRKMRKRT